MWQADTMTVDGQKTLNSPFTPLSSSAPAKGQHSGLAPDHFSFEFGAGAAEQRPPHVGYNKLHFSFEFGREGLSPVPSAGYILLHFSFEFGWYGSLVEPVLAMRRLSYLLLALLLGNTPTLLSAPCWCRGTCAPGLFPWIRMGLKRCPQGWFQLPAWSVPME